MKVVGTTDLKKAHGTKSAEDYLHYLAGVPNVALAELKEARIAALNEACNAFILSGFTSNALGEPHVYDFDEEGQSNLAQKATMLVLKPEITTVQWKTNKGIKEHTRDQFIQLLTDGEQHKEGAIFQYWTLVDKVMKTTSRNVVLETTF